MQYLLYLLNNFQAFERNFYSLMTVGLITDLFSVDKRCFLILSHIGCSSVIKTIIELSQH